MSEDYDVQSAPSPNVFRHTWGYPHFNGYASCPCGAVENTQQAANMCPLAIERLEP